MQGWKSSRGDWSGDKREAGAREDQHGESLVPGDDASSGVTAEADSPRGKPLWSRDAVLGVNHSYDLLQIQLSCFFP